MFHLGWFIAYGFGPQSWNQTWSGNGGIEWSRPQLYVDQARAMERAGFDFLMFEDSSMVPDQYEGSMRQYLAGPSYAPKHDPVPLLSVLGTSTSRLGLVATVATPFYHPFMAARLFGTLDHITEGRVGLNLVTSSNVRAAQNYGLDEHIEHDLRYKMAEEWVDCAKALWDAWDPDAVVLDEERAVFADADKVRVPNFQGEYYRSRGPLNVIPSPQGRPVITQAGGSPAGREFGAMHSDAILSNVQGGPDKMKAYREDVHERLLAHGRKPSECKVLFLVNPVLADTDAEAQERYRLQQLGLSEAAKGKDGIAGRLASISTWSGIDFSQFDLDAPLPDLTTNGHQSNLADLMGARGDRTLRETLAAFNTTRTLDLVGSPDTVAAQMAEAMQEVGGDGFMIASPLTRKVISEITDGLVPALRRRGVTRSGYEHERFRDNLLAF
ncbi:NtaA/DmoA family FMN-dependent monooxygenase [Pseudonocardia pini]|uniref:NtaA/DmoA family FMN-dependent monooxygenase n=1 Tax=Pseudonocardia pini TaxID=2758030 RepID=UPI0015F01484|nr:NtaA/DmoA family FMN-dependent monooxygenase [Pseudonocardia pini]